MKRITAVLLCVIFILSVSGCGRRNVTWNGETESFVELLMVEDISDINRYVGLVDYVFVGTVTEVIDDVLPDTIKKHEDHYSTYRIRVDQNLKGELADEIEVSKMGGLKRDGTMCLVTAELPSGVMITDLGLPEVDHRYVFLAYAQPDGSLTLSEIFDHRECTDEIISEYEGYVENEIVFVRERFLSKYDLKK